MMTEQALPGGTDPNSVRKVMNVQAPPAVAWKAFRKSSEPVCLKMK